MTLIDFVRESNRIEGIMRDPTEHEVAAFDEFLGLKRPDIADLERFVGIYQPGAVLRRSPGLNVRVGNHIAPRGGPDIATDLLSLLEEVANGLHPYEGHVRYETLQPIH